jgi:hypothetical protein
MRTSGIKIDIDKSDKLLLDNSKKIEKIIKFAVKQAVLQNESIDKEQIKLPIEPEKDKESLENGNPS